MTSHELEKQAVCASLNSELKRFETLQVSPRATVGEINNSRIKINALCDRLDAIDGFEAGTR